jgi:hypothetical protein
MDERQAAKWGRAFTVYGLSMMLGGMAIGWITYILLPIWVAMGIAAGVALIASVIAIRAHRTIKTLAKTQAKSSHDSPSQPSN